MRGILKKMEQNQKIIEAKTGGFIKEILYEVSSLLRIYDQLAHKSFDHSKSQEILFTHKMEAIVPLNFKVQKTFCLKNQGQVSML